MSKQGETEETKEVKEKSTMREVISMLIYIAIVLALTFWWCVMWDRGRR